MKNIFILWLGLCLGALSSCREDELSGVPDAVMPVETAEKSLCRGLLNVKFSRCIADSLQLLLDHRGSLLSAVRTRAVGDLIADLGKDARIRPLFSSGGKYAGRRRAAGLDQWFRLEFDPALQPWQVATRAGAGIERMEEVYRPVFEEGQRLSDKVYDLLSPFRSKSIGMTGMPFDDPRLAEQWHYDRGSVTAAAEAGIGLFRAWQKTTGSPRVIVAVLDQGIDYAHEDLADNMWVNEAELNGVAYDDDDNNGYDDDIYGYDFSIRSGAVTGMDHGTHIAGTISAVNNNGKGVCGIAGGSGRRDGVKVMCCQIKSKHVAMEGIEDAFAYAADNGAVICSCSWYLIRVGEALEAAIDYFNTYAGSEEGSPMKGGMVFFAAGNDNRQSKLYPPAWENVWAVASLNAQNRRSYFSNYGDWVDLAAPGGGNETDLGQNILSTLPGNQYGYMQGTSMACPHVAGIAALVVSQHTGDGNFTNADLKEILTRSVTDLGTMDEDAALMGAGLLRADLAVGADGGRNVAPVLPEEIQLHSGLERTLSWKVCADEQGNIPTAYLVYAGLAPLSMDKAYTVVTAENAREEEVIACPLKAFVLNGDYEVVVKSRNLWGKLSPASEALRLTWQNDFTAPETVTDARVTVEGGRYVVRWEQVPDRNDGVAVAYNISCRDKELRLLDTVMWVGKVEAGKELVLQTKLADAGGEWYFTLTPVDEWGNWGKESRQFQCGGSVDITGRVYATPNPVRAETTVRWGSDYKGIKRITVYDAAARQILTKNAGAVESTCLLDLSTLSAGGYTVCVESETGKTSFMIRKI